MRARVGPGGSRRASTPPPPRIGPPPNPGQRPAARARTTGAIRPRPRTARRPESGLREGCAPGAAALGPAKPPGCRTPPGAPACPRPDPNQIDWLPEDPTWNSTKKGPPPKGRRDPMRVRGGSTLARSAGRIDALASDGGQDRGGWKCIPRKRPLQPKSAWDNAEPARAVGCRVPLWRPRAGSRLPQTAIVTRSTTIVEASRPCERTGPICYLWAQSLCRRW